MPACFLNDYGREKTEYGRFIRVVGPVNGLIYIHHRQSNGPIAVCNPSVGKIYVLPESPTCSFYKYPKTVCRDVGISYDNVVPDYKVVQLLSCRGHRRLHASIYSRTTNCWRELLARDAVFDQDVCVQKPIRSSCQNGSISHWQAVRAVGEDCDHVILSFDAKNEVFRTLEMPDYGILKSFGRVRVFAKGGDSFVLVIYPKLDFFGAKGPKSLMIFEARFEGNRVRWDCMSRVGPFGANIRPSPKALWKRGCVVLEHFSTKRELTFYDNCAHEVVGCFEVAGGTFKTFEYKGSIISP